MTREHHGAGSQTNASDAIDDVTLPPSPSIEELLDEAVKETFPASDPIAVARAKSVWELKQPRNGSGSAATSTTSHQGTPA